MGGVFFESGQLFVCSGKPGDVLGGQPPSSVPRFAVAARHGAGSLRQLTPIGAPGPNLHIANEVAKNQFKVAGGAPGMKVCWQVTGIRQDKWAKDHPLAVEQDKRSKDVRFLDAQSPRQVEAFNRWIKEDRAETEALMSAQSQRMEELRKGIQKKK